MTILISIGKWGGIYWSKGKCSTRLCLGWIAFTILPWDDEPLMEYIISGMEKELLDKEMIVW